MSDEETCTLCPHSGDAHVLIAPGGSDPEPYGIRLCPVLGCQCYATWALYSVAYPPEPFTADEVAALRSRVQSDW